MAPQSIKSHARWPRLFAVLVVVCAGLVGPAAADDHILLQEVMPGLRGNVVGLLELGQAPPPGASRTVRRGEIVRALRQAGHDPDAYRIPRRVRVERRARELDGDTLVELTRKAIAEQLSPCEVQQTWGPSSITVAAGPLQVHAQSAGKLRSGSRTVIAELHAGGRIQHVPMRVRLHCPPPAVRAGSRVRVVAVVGPVRASAMGEARQNGQVGDTIVVRNTTTGVTLKATVVDEATVEVLQ